jgi:hypothetical protein
MGDNSKCNMGLAYWLMLRFVLCILALTATSALADSFGFSERCFDDERGVVVFTRKTQDKKYLRLNDLTDHSTKEITITRKSSLPIAWKGKVVVCYYETHKISLYDYELKPLSETDLGAGVAPYYSNCSSDGRFLYVYVVQFTANKNTPTRSVFRYTYVDGRLTYAGSCMVEMVGKIIEYKDAAFVVNDTSCSRLEFTEK